MGKKPDNEPIHAKSKGKSNLQGPFRMLVSSHTKNLQILLGMLGSSVASISTSKAFHGASQHPLQRSNGRTGSVTPKTKPLLEMQLLNVPFRRDREPSQ